MTFNPGPWVPLMPRTFTDSLEAERDRLRAEVRQYQAVIEQLNDKAKLVAAVVSVSEKHVLLRNAGELFEAHRPPSLPELRCGSLVRVNQNLQIVALVDQVPAVGVMHRVTRDLGDKHCEVQQVGTPALRAVLFYGAPPEVGDQVVLDVSGSVILKNTGKPASPLQYAGDTGVDWDDIGGQEEAKQALREAIEHPIQHREVFARYGKARTKGILLWGPAGCGKTLFARAAATAMARLHGASAKATGYQYIKGPELLSKWVGGTEEGVRAVFAQGREHFAQHGYPAIAFIDEADALLAARGQQRAVEGMERTTVPQFLAEMDGMDDSGVIVLLATNRPEALDPALVREGRIDRKVHVRRPNEDEAKEIVGKALGGKPIASGAEEERLAARAVEEIWSDRHALYRIKRKSKVIVGDELVTLGAFVSGAMCVGIVERAVASAMRREIAGAGEKGIHAGDISDAVAAAKRELEATNHKAALTEYLADREDVESVEPVRKRAAQSGRKS